MILSTGENPETEGQGEQSHLRIFARVAFWRKICLQRMDLLQYNRRGEMRPATQNDAEGELGSDDGWEIPEEVYPVLYKLAREWTDIKHRKNLRLKPMKGAMTNQVFQCQWDPTITGEKPRKVLVRVYGESSELFFRREDEMLTFESMSNFGQGPRLLARFPNGRVEEFLHARTLAAEDLRNPEISDKIAKRMRHFHSLHHPGPAESQVWERLRGWLEKTLELATPEVAEGFRLHSLGKELVALKKRIERPGEIIGFCHNDLQYGNIMMDEIEGTVTLIDYEYASFNPVAFDIANFFCEMAANYHTDTPHILDYSQYPDDDERLRFVSSYLQEGEELVAGSEVEALMKDVNAYACVSHLHWTLWGIISAFTSELDFDFMAYASQRFQQYSLLKTLERESSLNWGQL